MDAPSMLGRGDYDRDDYGYGAVDGDDDDSTPIDRDGDSDNTSGSYYDRDDSSIRELGHAANTRDRRTVTKLVKRYLDVAAEEDGATACTMIIPSVAKSIPEDVGRPPGLPFARGKTCAVVMSKVFKKGHQQLATYAARAEVARVRLNHDAGLAVLRFRGLPGRQIGVIRESGRWRIDGLLDSELP